MLDAVAVQTQESIFAGERHAVCASAVAACSADCCCMQQCPRSSLLIAMKCGSNHSSRLMRCCRDPLQFLARAPAGCLARIRGAVREHVLDKSGAEIYSIMLKMHLAMTEVRVGPPRTCNAYSW